MLSINAIKKGIVIDHIPQGYGVAIFEFLKLQNVNYSVALIMNVTSNKMIKKDIIKIQNDINTNLDILGIISDKITINIIENEKIKNKYNPGIPHTIENIISCKNPRCITSIENNVISKFILINKDTKEYCCNYCEDIMVIDKLK